MHAQVGVCIYRSSTHAHVIITAGRWRHQNVKRTNPGVKPPLYEPRLESPLMYTPYATIAAENAFFFTCCVECSPEKREEKERRKRKEKKNLGSNRESPLVACRTCTTTPFVVVARRANPGQNFSESEIIYQTAGRMTLAAKPPAFGPDR